MANSKKRCRECHKYGLAKNMKIVPLGAFCGQDCAITYASRKTNKAKVQQVAEKEVRKQIRKDKERVKTLGEHKRELQAIFNKWIRLRDKDEPCISCQRYHTGQYHAGHYRSVGSCPELRYEPLNNNKQCSSCNSHLSGNLINYRINLINKIGLDKVEWLEGPHEAKRYTIDDIKQMKAHYRKLIRDMES